MKIYFTFAVSRTKMPMFSVDINFKLTIPKSAYENLFLIKITDRDLFNTSNDKP